MNILVTGGAGFIGRWVVKQLLDLGHNVWVLDNLCSGRIENIKALLNHEHFVEFIQGDIKDQALVSQLFDQPFQLCFHLAASINIQNSIDDPRTTFNNDAGGTFNILEGCRKHRTKMIYMSTCMVYDKANLESGITESSAVKAASPYAGAKLAGESMVQSYFYTYDLPVVIARPFNTYGPFQKTCGEGGVIAIFIQKELTGTVLDIYGEGTQTRDLLYVEDCARFLIACGLSDTANGHILNAGTAQDISINDLAALICPDPDKIMHVPHIHLRCEIPKLVCDYSKAKLLLNWKPTTTLKEGIALTREWIKTDLS